MGRRAEARAGCKALLDRYKTTYTDADAPTYLAHVHDYRPGRVTGRSAWVNKEVSEQIGFGANVQQRVLAPSITVINKIANPDQAADEQDAIVDALIDLTMTASVQTAIRAVTGGVPLLPASVDDEEVTQDDGVYTGFRVTFSLPTQGGRTI